MIQSRQRKVPSAAGLNWMEYDDEYIIPDLTKWSQVKVGMSEDEVIDLLGEPINRIDPDGAYMPNCRYPRYYGYTSKKSAIFQHDLDLVVSVEMGKVVDISDWFGGVEVSKDGSPTIPKLLKPQDEVVLCYYPRVVDFRWFASSGAYPMHYDIDVDTYYPTGKWSDNDYGVRVKQPFYSYVHGGSNKGRWRVRAINCMGTSEWSDYQHFTFSR